MNLPGPGRSTTWRKAPCRISARRAGSRGLNTGELDLPGLRVTDGEPEMRRDLVPALSKPEACPLFRTRSSTLARGTALGRPRDMRSAATLNRTYCGAGAGAGAGAGSGAGAGASVAAGVASTGFPCMMQSYVARSNANLQPCRMPWTTPNAIAAINSMRIRRMCSSLPCGRKLAECAENRKGRGR